MAKEKYYVAQKVLCGSVVVYLKFGEWNAECVEEREDATVFTSYEMAKNAIDRYRILSSWGVYVDLNDFEQPRIEHIKQS